MPLPVLFGANVEPNALPVGRSSEQALLIDRLGLDLLTVQDHPYQAAFDDTCTLLTFLAARTRHVTLVPTVGSLPLRPPAVLAKAVATLDRLTGSRVQLGLGAGAFWEAIAGMGGSRRTPQEAVDALEEAINVIRAMWSGERSVRTHGAHFRSPAFTPARRRPPVWDCGWARTDPHAGAEGAKADGWLPSHAYLGLDALPTAVRRIDDAALPAGRDPDTIRRIYNITGAIQPGSAGPFQGPAAQWAEHLVTLVRDIGMNGFVIWPERDHAQQIRAFTAEVVPAVREALAQET
ncbi:LLM class flavin-dependent oxidoreductase [Streptomyces rishiriensis]|uniref:LLM class flavin-dependent oxidoreductase n=1 Tax=Streptomyces rishiriensis TaxID=68264 RepID=UPI0037D74B0C